ncbi:hypothetical protein [Neobacillus sp. 114]|uniref:hypothetical protein n=1 Tax=Neobacillus sp. 114 TaxID=3048535 RepID=UPI0024C42C3D|nr:hypothetical protein [Neobacillus sp. 114]
MVFKTKEIQQMKFSKWDELNYYVELEKESLVLVPLEDFFDNNSIFCNDEFFGRNGEWVNFNEYGLMAFFRLINIPPYIINNLSKEGLASNVLNTFLREPSIRSKLKNYQFVINLHTMTVSGIVSNSYMPYSNHSFLKDLSLVFPDMMAEYSIEESYMVNSSLYLRLLSPNYKAGIITKDKNQAEDISRIGIQLTNGMTGRNAIKASYFVYRLIYSNGLILPCSEVRGIVVHSGKKETFRNRISKNILPVIEKVSDIPEKIETLGSISFDLEKLAEIDGAKFVYDIIPLDYVDIKKREKLRGKEKIDFDKEKLEEYINKYSLEHSRRVFHTLFRDNQSMFDFVNIFTEYAKTQKPREKTKIEEKTGEFSSWVLKNKKQFC